MRRPVKQVKNGVRLIPRMFKTLTIYLMLTMSVFFGYVVLFGDVKPQEIQLPTDDTNASDDTLFGGLVQSFNNFENIDTDFDLSFENADASLKLSLSGNIVFDAASGGLELNDLDIQYNQDHFLISAVYTAPYLYLSVDQNGQVSTIAETNMSESKTYYKFDLTSEGGERMGFSQILDFAVQKFDIDMSFIEDVEEYIGVDFENFNPNDLLAKLKIEEKQRENGDIIFNISLNSISAQIICQSDFAIKSIALAPLKLQGNKLNFSANVNKMNEDDVKVEIEEGVNDVDMTAVTEYVGYAKNLFANKFIQGDVTVVANGETFDAKVYCNNEDAVEIMFKTIVEGVEAFVAFSGDEIYLSVADVKVKFKAEDYLLWQATLDEIFVKHAGQTLSQHLKTLIEAGLNVDLDAVDLEKEMTAIVSSVFTNVEMIEEYLPEATILDENSFRMLWGNGLEVKLEKSAGVLNSVNVDLGNSSVSVDFSLVESGFEIGEEFYDITTLLPLSGVVDAILETKQFGGLVQLDVAGLTISAGYVVDLKDEIFAQIETVLFGENVKIVLSGDEVYFCLGDVVVSGNVENFELYINRIESLFGVKVDVSEQGTATKLQVKKVLTALLAVIEDLVIVGEQDKIAVIKYLSAVGEVTLLDEKMAKIAFEADKLNGSVSICATEEEVSGPVATDSIDGLFEKMSNVKVFVESKQYAFEFDVKYFDETKTYIDLSGDARIDLVNEAYEVTGLEVGGNTLNLAYVDGIVYVEYAGEKIKANVSTVMGLVKVLMPIVGAYVGGSDMGEMDYMALAGEAFGQDVSTLSITELIDLVTMKVTGTLGNLGIEVYANTTNAVKANVGVEFVGNELNVLNLSLQDMAMVELQVKEFEAITIAAGEYYNLTSKHLGYAEVTYVDGEDEITITADVALGLGENVYLKLTTVVMGEVIEVVVLNGSAYVTVGDITLEVDLAEIDGLVNEAMAILEMTRPENVEVAAEAKQEKLTLKAIGELLKSIDLNSFNFKDIDGLTWTIKNGERLAVTFEKDNISVELTMFDDKSFKELAPAANATARDVLEKMSSVKALMGQRQFAVNLNVKYGKFAIGGNIYFDMDAASLSAQGLIVGNNTLNLVIVNDVAYVEYGNEEDGMQRIKAKISCVKDVVAMVMPIVNAFASSGEESNSSDILSELMVEIFGQDVLEMTTKEIVDEIYGKISGNIDALMLNVLKKKTDSEDIEVETGVSIGFADKKLSKVSVSLRKTDFISAKVIEFVAPAVEDEDVYYDLTSAHKGTFVATLTKDKKSASISGSVELDLVDEVYLKLATSICGLAVEVVVLNNVAYLTIGTLCAQVSLDEIATIKEFIMANFDISESEPEAALGMLEMIGKFNLNGFNPFAIEGLSWSADGEVLSAVFENNGLVASISLNDEQTPFAKDETEGAESITLPTQSEDVMSLLKKVKSILDIYTNGVLETEFNAHYNGFQFVGKFKLDLNREIIELADVVAYSETANVFEEKVNIRLQKDPETGKDTLFLAFGNMKYKFAIEASGTDGETLNMQEALAQITSKEFGVVIDFGIFVEIVALLRDYSITDYINNILVGFTRTLESDENGDVVANNIGITLKDKNGKYSSPILTAIVNFFEDAVAGADIQVYDLVSAKLTDVKTSASTIKEMATEEYKAYSEDFIKGMLASLEVQSGVYAFSSEIAIRYSLNTFYGELTAMIVEEYDENNNFVGYSPRISIHTSALGLSSYIYLISNEVYIDVSGLQIKADLTKTTIEEILSFMEENFGLVLEQSGVAAQASYEDLAEPFRVVLPALDKIFGLWLESGIQIDVKDSVQYATDSFFRDIVIQAFVQNYENTIMPTSVVIGANIEDPNTTIYDSYEGHWLEKDGKVFENEQTQTRNFAAYLDNINVGRFISEELAKTFVSTTGYRTIESLKSNASTTSVAEYNSYATVLDMAKSAYAWAVGENDGNEDAGEYKLQISGSIAGANSKTEIGANVVMQLGTVSAEDLANDNVMKLFDDKYLKVQGNFDIQNYQDNVMLNKNLVDIFYQSNDSGAVYVTYSADDYTDDDYSKSDVDPKGTNNIGKHAFMGKIKNGSLSSVVSMLCKFMKIELGENLENAIGIDASSCTTDFEFVQKLLGVGVVDVGDGTSKVDTILSSIENVTALLYGMNLNKKAVGSNGEQTLYATALTIYVDKDLDATTVEGDANSGNVSIEDMATIQLRFVDEIQSNDEIVQKLQALEISNMMFGGSLLNLTVGFGDLNTSSFDYDDVIDSGNDILSRLKGHASKRFSYDVNATYTYKDADNKNVTKGHIDCSTLSEIVDMAVSSINTQNFTFEGTVGVNVIKLVNLTMGIDLHASIDENGKIYAYVQFETKSSGLLGGLATSIAFDGDFDVRHSVLEYKDDKLYLSRFSQTKEKHGGFLGIGGTTWYKVKQDSISKSVYEKQEIMPNILTIVKDLFGFNQNVMSKIIEVIGQIDPHPTLERVLLNYTKTTTGYEAVVNGQNLLGSNGAKNMTLKISESAYKGYINSEGNSRIDKTFKFVEGFSTTMDISGAVIVDLNIHSLSAARNSNKIQIKTSYNQSDGAVYGNHYMNSNDAFRRNYISTVGGLY